MPLPLVILTAQTQTLKENVIVKGIIGLLWLLPQLSQKMISAIWLRNLVIFMRMRKLKNPKMKMYAKMKGRTTFKKSMTLYWKIVANTPKLLTLL